MSVSHGESLNFFCPGKVVGISRINKDIQRIHYQERMRTRRVNPAWKTTATAWYFTILWLASLRFIWCSFVSRLQGKTRKHSKWVNTLASFLKTYQNIEKSLVVSTKKSDMSWITLWLSFLSGVNRRASSYYLTKMV